MLTPWIGRHATSSLISTPTELIKVHQQLLSDRSPAKRPSTAGEVAAGIFRQHGLRGLYRGITATALRDSGYGAYFAAYEATLMYFPPSTPPNEHDHSDLTTEADTTFISHSWSTLLLAGGVAGIAGWLVTFPFDVVKTRVQSTPANAPNNPYRSTWSTIVASCRAEGVGVFFRGLVPTLIR